VPISNTDFQAGLTLTATVNPDFGQVEVDPAVVNLSAYETFFPEKRPFFVEGSNTFNIGSIIGGPSYGNQQIFYSRRIGRAPQRFPDGQFVDAPDATTILGAGKLTGKVGPWTVGMLNAVTGEEHARVIDGSNLESTTPVEPLTNYFVGRVSHDFRGGNTIVARRNRGESRSERHRVQEPRPFERRRRQPRFRAPLGRRQWSLSGAFSRSLINGRPR
jgi:hypothetical protein